MLLPLIHIVVPVRELLEEATVGEKIAFYRFKADLTQEELAERLNIDRKTILRYENGTMKLNLRIINEIAEQLKIPPTFLYDDYFSFLAYPYSEKIKEILSDNCISTKKLAELVFVHNKTIKRWKKQVIPPNRENYEKLKELNLV